MNPTPAVNDEPTAHASALGYSRRRRSLVFAVVGLAFVMDLLDVTIVNVAIPSIQAGLHASNAAIQWSLAGFTLAFAVLLITGGRLGDVFGYRTLFLLGTGLFMLTSLACGLAPDADVLVTARILQGASAALMMPQVMALMQVMYPPAERIKVYAMFGVLGGTAAALGPVLGGVLIQANWFSLGWRLCFLINLPVGLISLLAGFHLLPRGRGVQAMPLDIKGMLLSMLWLASMVLPLIEGPHRDWPLWTVALLVASVPLGWMLWRHLGWRSKQTGAALINPSLLQMPAVHLGLLCSICVNGITPAYMMIMSIVLQNGMHYTPLQMALLCLPVAAGSMIGISIIGQYLLRVVGTHTIVIGCAVSMLSVLLIGWTLHSTPDLMWLLLGQLGFGLGLGLTGPSVSAITFQDVPLSEAGSASGLVATATQTAGALAVAAVGLVFFPALAKLLATSPDHPVDAYAGAYLHALPLILSLLIAGALCVIRMPVLQHKTKVLAH